MDLEDEILKKFSSPVEKVKPTCCATNGETHQFNFPYEPYDIQLQLMKVATETFEDSKFALLESPTGTGKSLSLICSSLTWLKDHQLKVKQKLETEKQNLIDKIEELRIEEEKTGDWLIAQTKRKDLDRQLDGINSELDKILKVEQKSEARRHAKLHHHSTEDYAILGKSRNGGKDEKQDQLTSSQSILASQDSQAIEEEEDGDMDKRIEREEVEHVRPQIYFASRTHSQLSQFINEIKKTKFADSNDSIPIKVAPLASRANLCVNQDVLKLKDPSAINEKCMEMQKETNKEKRCPYAKASQVSMLKEDILSSVQDIEDIASRGRIMGSCAYYASRMAVPEAELVVLPYNNLLHFETRKASSLDLKGSIVILDEAHNILETICSIHSAPITGQQLIASHTILSRYYKRFHNKMSPKNATTIHNIVKCLTAMIRFLDSPKEHLNDFESATPVKIDLQTLDNNKPSLCSNTNGNPKGKQPIKLEELMIDINKFIGAANIKQFNIFKLIDYFNRSQLARKLLGFIRQDNTIDLDLELHGLQDVAKGDDKPVVDVARSGEKAPKRKRKTLSGQQAKNEKPVTIDKADSTALNFLRETNPKLKSDNLMTSYPIYTLVEFLRALTNFPNDGKVLVSCAQGDVQQSVLKFVLLNPSSQFKQMTEDAKSIVLAGGTMQPFSEFVDLLFGPLGIDKNRLKLFSCGHVVKPSQIFVSAMSHGPTGKPLELSYKTRTSFDLIDEIGRALLNIATSVPGGMVCFLPSYDYEQFCFNRWTQVGVLRMIETKAKQIFREPRQTNHLKPVLDEYCRTVEKSKEKGRGALLFCVVGGKMSEGINFNDDLGRCIVMIGLPYANVRSSELQQKMAYYDRTCTKQSANNGPVSQQISSAGQQYYENLCIKGVNQSIGRAIRHRQDYAAIILLDRRYSSKTSIKSGLPAWLRQSLVDHERFGLMLTELQQFFKNK